MSNYQLNCAYWGRIKDFLNSSDDLIVKNITDGIYKLTGEYPEIEQRKAWQGAIPLIKRVFEKINQDLHFVVEYKLPLSDERIDLIICGKSKSGQASLLVFELKGWNKAEEKGNYIVEVNGEKFQHPELQLLNYLGKLKFSHSTAKNFEILGLVWLYNLKPGNNIKFNIVKSFFEGQIPDIANFIKENLKGPIDENEVQKFLSGKFELSNSLLMAIKKNFENLKKGAYDALCSTGFGPSEEQTKIIYNILEKVKNNEKYCYIIYGPPGSGKSYIAIILLLEALSEKYTAVIGYRNNRLINTMRKIFSECEPGLDSVIKFYSTGKNTGLAEENSSPSYFRLVIYDEAQRMTKTNIKIGMQRGNVSVFFFDDGQILNADEEGWQENFIEAAKSLKIPYEVVKLKGLYRVKGGYKYHKFVEELLTGKSGLMYYDTNYEFKIFADIEDMIEELKNKASKNYKVALVAAFTESPGDRKNPTGETIENLRVGYPLYSGFERYKNKNLKIYWLMDAKDQYPSFWYKGESNKLTHCASIYGCQGFEADYVGVIWGRDFVWRGEKWKVGVACEDTVGSPSLKKIMERAIEGDKNSNELALKLLINRYRIFLTRGIFGTYIYCEDDETYEYLESIINSRI